MTTAAKKAAASQGETPAQKEAREKALREAYAAAQKTLRETHRTEFNELYKAGAIARGYDWNPTPTKAEKAEEELRRMAAEFPELAEKYGLTLPGDAETEPATDDSAQPGV